MKRLTSGVVLRHLGASLGLALLSATSLPLNANAQASLRAERKIAHESGRASMGIARGPGGKLYVLNREDRCVWVFDSNGNSLGRISSAGQGPADLLEPKDFAVDRVGNVIVADGSGMIKIFEPGGKLNSAFTFERPQHVGVLSDGRVLISGFPTAALIEVFDRSGKRVGQIGEPIKEDTDPFFNSVLNHGFIVVDEFDYIYYVFRFRLTPTVRKYSTYGELIAEWQINSPHLDGLTQRAKAKYVERKSEGGYGGTPIFNAASYDSESRTLWLGSGDAILQIDANGKTTRFHKLQTPDLRPIPIHGIVVEGSTVRVASYLVGVHEVLLPK